MSIASYRTHWSAIESAIEVRNDPEELRVLKTVGVLNLLNVDDLRPTEEAVCWAVGGTAKTERRNAAEALKKLVSGKVLHFRGEARGYSLWPYTNVDIDSRMDEAKRTIPSVSRISQAINEQLDTRPIVARSHYIKTGNLRYFDVVYCNVLDLADKANNPDSQADGLILFRSAKPKPSTKKPRRLPGNFPTTAGSSDALPSLARSII